MPRHAAWHCIIQQAALCCFLSSIAAVFLSLGSHSSTRVTSKHGQPTCLHRRVYGEVNDDTWRRAALVLEACSTGGSARWLASLVDRCTALSPARHGDPQHKLVYGTVSAIGRYNWRTGWRLSHGAPCKTVVLDIAPYQSCRTEGLHTNCTCILLTDTNYV